MALGGIKTGLSFSGFNPSGAGTGGAGAAENASVAENFSALESTKPKFGQMEQTRVQAESAKRQAAMEANASVRANALGAMASYQSNKLRAEAAAEAAQKKAQGSMMGSVIKAGTGLLGAAIMSDETTKNSIERLDDAMATLRALRPVTFYYNEEYSSSPERLHYGFIAQEYITEMPDATYFDESTGKLCIDTAELISLLVRAVQQLETKVTRLEAANALVGV